MLSDNTIHIGQPIIEGKEAVRTPSLRNVALTAPFLHDGSRATLSSAVLLYEGRDDLEVTLEDDDFGDIIAFFNTLTDEAFYRNVPSSVPSGLNVGGDIRPINLTVPYEFFMRVLIVEDNRSIAESIGEYLSLYGHVVEFAFNGEMALSILKTNEYDVMVCWRS